MRTDRTREIERNSKRRAHAANRDVYNAKKRAARARDPERYRAYGRKAAAGGVDMKASRPAPAHCELCGEAFLKTPHFDHCHTTNTFRGWLCSRCNHGLGLFRDNPMILMRAADYVLLGGPL